MPRNERHCCFLQVSLSLSLSEHLKHSRVILAGSYYRKDPAAQRSREFDLAMSAGRRAQFRITRAQLLFPRVSPAPATIAVSSSDRILVVPATIRLPVNPPQKELRLLRTEDPQEFARDGKEQPRPSRLRVNLIETFIAEVEPRAEHRQCD